MNATRQHPFRAGVMLLRKKIEHTISKLGNPPNSAHAALRRTLVAGGSAWRWLTRRLGINVVIAGFCLALIGVTWSGVVAHMQLERQNAIENAIKQNTNLALAFEEHTLRTTKEIDADTRFLTREYKRLGTRIKIANYIESGIIDGKLFVALNLTNERGEVVASNHAPIGLNMANLEQFLIHVQRDSGKLFIGKPTLGRINGKWLIPMTRRINKPDGSFGGVVSMAVDPKYFSNFYQQADLGTNGVVDLVGLDGISRVRQSGRVSSFGHDMSKSSLLKEQATKRIGSFLSSGRIESVPRYLSYRTIPDYSLIVMVGTSQDEMLTDHSKGKRLYYGAALLISAVIGLMAALLILALGRQKRAVAALSGSNAQFRATFEQAAVGIAHTTIDRRYLQVNQKFCDMLGYTRDELLMMRSNEIAFPGEQEIGPNHERTLAGKINTYSGEKRYIRKDGTVIWTNRTVSLARDSAGQPLYFIRVIEDITARKEAEGRFSATFAQAAVGIAHIASDNFRILMVNRKFCELLGYTQDELIGTDSRTQTLPGETPEREAERAQLVAGKIKSSSCERRLLRKDGSLLWVNRSLSLVLDPAGQPQYYISVIEDITERKQLQQELHHRAHHDTLTRLPNRELFYDRLEHALGQAQRRNWITSVMFIDLDGFKMVNDTLGHNVGDQLLQQVSVRLAECVRADDTVGRLGGDEFAIVLSELAREQDGGLVAQKIIDVLAKPFQIDEHEIFITASIGITTCPPDSAVADDLISNADAAMYGAKKLGKNNYQFYTAEMNERAMEKLLLEKDLRHALMRNEFVLHFQPKTNLHTGKITGVEALLRWQRPGGRLVPPAEFIPLLEESGLILPVGEWVLRAACAQISAWREGGITPVPIAINLSAKQFHRQDISALVMNALQEYKIAPHLLELEITESAAMQNAEATITTLHNLKALGVRIAIDDFGTGYSSLSYLKRFPIDSLKIDRSFVTDLPGDGDDASIAQAVITMAHAMRVKVIAEGVENEAQLEFLTANRCDEMQGYYFSKPLSADDCTEFLREFKRLPRVNPKQGAENPAIFLVDDD